MAVLVKSHGSQSAHGLMCRFLSWAQLLVDTSVPGSSIVPKYSKRVLEIALEGIGAACSVSVWPPIIRCPAILELGQVSLLIPQNLLKHRRKMLNLLQPTQENRLARASRYGPL